MLARLKIAVLFNSVKTGTVRSIRSNFTKQPTGRRALPPDVNLTALDATLRAAPIALRYSDAKRIDRGSVQPLRN